MNNYIEQVLFNEDLLCLIARNLNYGRSKLNQVCHSMRLPLTKITNDLKQTKKYKLINQWNIETRMLPPKFLILTGIDSISYTRDMVITTSPIQWIHKGIVQTYNTIYLLEKPSPSYIDDKFFKSNLNWYKTVLQAWHSLIR